MKALEAWNKRKNIELSNRSLRIISMLVVLVSFFLLMMKYPFVFIANDDRILQDIVSGTFTGTPDAHMIFVSYPLSLALSYAYKYIPLIPWYGLCQMACIFLSILVIVTDVFGCLRNVKRLLVVTIAYVGIFYLVFAKYIVMGTFTVTAGLLMAAAVFHFFMLPVGLSGKKFLLKNSITVCLCLLAFCVRQNAMLMLLPTAGIVWLLKVFWELRHTENRYQPLIPYFIFAGVLFGGVLVCYSWNAWAYSSPEWKDYIKYNDAETTIKDYFYGYPPYAAYEELYYDLGISQELHKGMQENYFLLFADIDGSGMEQLADASVSYYANDRTPEKRLYHTVTRLLRERMSDNAYPNNRVVVILYAALLLLIIIQKNKRAMVTLGFMWLGHLVSAFFLLYRGRFPHQIAAPLFMSEILMIAAVFLYFKLYELPERHKWFRYGYAAVAIASLLLVYKGAYGVCRLIEGEVFGYYSYARGLDVLNEYCEQHDENFYYVDNNSMNYFKIPVWKSEGRQYHNYLLTGGWIYNSPLVAQKLKDKGIQDPEEALVNHENIYVVFHLHEEFSQDYLWEYLTSKYNVQYELVEEIKATPEVTFGVYSVVNKS